MGEQNKENSKDLFAKFFDSEQADRAMEDIRQSEHILSKYPAPEPDKELIADIKGEIARNLLRKKATGFKRAVYRVAAAAAAVIILATISVKLFEKGSGRPEKVAAIPKQAETMWASSDIFGSDTELAALADEIDLIEEGIVALQTGETADNGDGIITELEMKLIEINGDFWKG